MATRCVGVTPRAFVPPMPMLTILKDAIIFNRMIWLLGFSYILVYLIRMAINDWGIYG